MGTGLIFRKVFTKYDDIPNIIHVPVLTDLVVHDLGSEMDISPTLSTEVWDYDMRHKEIGLEGVSFCDYFLIP